MPTLDEGRIPPGRAPGRAGAQTNTAPATSNTDLVAGLTLDEKVLLLTGADSWSTQGAELLGLSPMIMSDGPAGARGVTLDERQPSTSLPCPSALGATWDPDLVRDVAAALGAEARSKGIHVLLGPTINLMRSPVGGRGFECFSEDPVLTAAIAVGYVRGLQGAGVGATVKHYVGNDTETQRWSYDVTIAEHVLREMYLMPFEACVREADAALVMAAYNMVNGTPMTENAGLLKDVLKGEWGFTGVVTSDWHAARSTTATALATLDLSMPGPDGPWGKRLAQAVADGVVTEHVLDDKIVRLLRLARRVGALASHDGGGAAGGRGAARLVDPALVRRAAAASYVLLRNEGQVLPLRADQVASVAVLGPGAVRPTIQGGGSAVVAPVAVSTPAAALTARLAGMADVTAAEGCQIWTTVPEPAAGSLVDPVTGEPGLHLDFVAADGTMLRTEHRSTTALAWWDGLPPGVGWGEGGSIVLHASFRPAVSGPYLLGAAGVGHLTITVDGEVVADRPTAVPPDPVQAMTRPGQVRAGLDLQAGQRVSIRVQFRPAADGEGPLGLRLGIEPALDGDAMLAAAVAAASTGDTAIVVVGSAELTESEGFDRPGLALPGRQDELVSRVAEVNPRTIVVVNSGMPVLMPWAGRVAAIIQAWLPGQAMGEALADVLFGDAEPGGRLPVTLPAAEADCPVLHAAPADGVLAYDEGLLLGYRGYDAAGTTPLFAFGHGLGYTSWDYEAVHALTAGWLPGRDLDLRVVIRNAGARPGREVVQAYLAVPPGDRTRPVRVLAAFASASAAPGERAEVTLRIPARLFARWDCDLGAWTWPPCRYTVAVGRSSRDLRLSLPVHADLPEPPMVPLPCTV
ncbi:MAG TPA: glycoside hydrolase family 3 C-terminal domain-containing protein [Streptosporangiaceae bacterium]|nr:glycoside hydrolase family 3 C-terminal domain-containing protein [Streptosporangiaceae bacterium]